MGLCICCGTNGNLEKEKEVKKEVIEEQKPLVIKKKSSIRYDQTKVQSYKGKFFLVIL
jgi:hypothetical protein